MSNFKAKMHQIRSKTPACGAYSAPTDLLVGFKGPLRGLEREWMGWEREGKGMGTDGKGGDEGRESKGVEG